jgi:DNA-binding MarR family transcriptional regulator
MTYKIPRLTTKQRELMRVFVAGNGVDDVMDLDEVLENLEYDTTKQSLHFSIRALIKHGLVEKVGCEKRRGRRRQLLKVTPMGHAVGSTELKATDADIEDDIFINGAGLDPIFD